MHPDDPTGPSLEKELEAQRRGAQGPGGGNDRSSACDACDIVGCDNRNCDTPDCDIPGCDLCDGCNWLVLVRLSSLLLVAAAVLPETGGRALVRTLLRTYRRWLTRYTPACPSTPSCSAYAATAVESLGVRRGLRAAALRLRACR